MHGSPHFFWERPLVSPEMLPVCLEALFRKRRMVDPTLPTIPRGTNHVVIPFINLTSRVSQLFAHSIQDSQQQNLTPRFSKISYISFVSISSHEVTLSMSNFKAFLSSLVLLWYLAVVSSANEHLIARSFEGDLVSFYSLDAYSTQRTCVTDFLYYHLNDVLGCPQVSRGTTNGYLNGCFCRSDLIPVAETFLGIGVQSYCSSISGAPDVSDASSAISIYDNYCGAAFVDATTTVVDTSTDLSASPAGGVTPVITPATGTNSFTEPTTYHSNPVVTTTIVDGGSARVITSYLPSEFLSTLLLIPVLSSILFGVLHFR
jgi:hypothetical protein